MRIRQYAQGHLSEQAGVFIAGPEGEMRLPEWANFLTVLGSRVSQYADDRARLVVALAVPTRTFAAAFSAVGVVSARSVLPLDRGCGEDYLEWLCSLPQGSPVGYGVGKATLPATIKGCARENNTLYLHLSVGSRGGRVSRLPATAVSKIRNVSCAIGAPSLTVGALTDKGVFITGWCRHLLSGRVPSEFLFPSPTPCLIIGRINRLREEIDHTSFTVRSDTGQEVTGTLQDVLAVEQFGGRHDPVRTQVLAASRTAIAGQANAPVSVVVFDGASGFLRARDGWRQASWIVVLERSDPALDLAIDQINRDFVQRRLDDVTIKGLPAPPPGVELLYFREARE